MKAPPTHRTTFPDGASAFHYVLGDHEAPCTARRIMARVLGKGHVLLEAAQLVTSELVTNAVRHSQSGLPNGLVGLRIKEPGDDMVRVEVIDEGGLPAAPTCPALRLDPLVMRESGFGLVCVSFYAQDWGVVHHINGYCTVWALLRPAEEGNAA